MNTTLMRGRKAKMSGVRYNQLGSARKGAGGEAWEVRARGAGAALARAEYVRVAGPGGVDVRCAWRWSCVCVPAYIRE